MLQTHLWNKDRLRLMLAKMTDDTFYEAVCLAVTKNSHWGGDLALHIDDIRRFRKSEFNPVYLRQQLCDVLWADSEHTRRIFVWETDRVRPGVLLVLNPLVRMTLNSIPEFGKAKKRVVLYGTPPKKRPVKAPPTSRFDRDEIL